MCMRSLAPYSLDADVDALLEGIEELTRGRSKSKLQ
jgi:hypothetical protein